MACSKIYNMKKVTSIPGKEKAMSSLPNRIFAFYKDGFRSMILGRTLWKIILIKLFLLFAVLKIFFFPNYLNTHFETDTERASHVLANITGTDQTH